MTNMVNVLHSAPGKMVISITGETAYERLQDSSTRLLGKYLPVVRDLYTGWCALAVAIEQTEAQVKAVQAQLRPLFIRNRRFLKEHLQQFQQSLQNRQRERLITEIVLTTHLKQLRLLVSVANTIKRQQPETFSLVIEHNSLNSPEIKMLNYRFEMPFPNQIPSELTIERYADREDEDRESRIKCNYAELIHALQDEGDAE